MNVLEIFNEFSIGGVQRHILSLSDWLRQQGHRVWISGTPGAWLSTELDKQFLPIPLQNVRGDRLNQFSAWRDMATCVYRLRKLISSQNIELIHAHEIASAAVARGAVLGSKIPIILSYHGTSEDRFPTAAKQGKWLADQFIAVSETTARQMSDYGLPEPRIMVIPPSLEILAAPTSQAVADLRRQLLGEEGKILIVSVARLDRQKGVDILIAAAAEVIKSRLDVRFIVVGDGSEKSEICDLIQQVGIGQFFHLVGSCDNPRIYLEASDIFVLASRWEALPLAIPEAYRAGLPVVATDVGGVAEIVSDRVGAVVPSENPAALAQALLRIASNNELRKKMAAQARQEGQAERFDPNYIHAKIEAYYQDTIKT